MSASVSFDEAMSSLTSMFPDWDKETLEAVLASNDYHLERTVESILNMEPGAAPVATATNTNSTRTQMQEDERLARELSGGAAGDFSYPSNPAPATVPRHRNFRGTNVVLPDNFLRAPGWKNKSSLQEDEQLALMLQNEMFREEVRAALGKDFAYGGRQPNGSTNSVSQGPDLGIMKTISEMGVGMKNRISALAADFSRRSNSGYTQAPQEERASLLGKDGKQDDDEEEETVAFSDKPTGARKKFE